MHNYLKEYPVEFSVMFVMAIIICIIVGIGWMLHRKGKPDLYPVKKVLPKKSTDILGNQNELLKKYPVTSAQAFDNISENKRHWSTMDEWPQWEMPKSLNPYKEYYEVVPLKDNGDLPKNKSTVFVITVNPRYRVVQSLTTANYAQDGWHLHGYNKNIIIAWLKKVPEFAIGFDPVERDNSGKSATVVFKKTNDGSFDGIIPAAEKQGVELGVNYDASKKIEKDDLVMFIPGKEGDIRRSALSWWSRSFSNERKALFAESNFPGRNINSLTSREIQIMYEKEVAISSESPVGRLHRIRNEAQEVSDRKDAFITMPWACDKMRQMAQYVLELTS